MAQYSPLRGVVMWKKSEPEGWQEWGRHVLAELERLNQSSIDQMRTLEQTKDILRENTNSLRDHMRRTENLEKRVAPIEEHVKEVAAFFTFAKKSGVWLVSICGAAAAIGTIVHFIARAF